MTPLLGSAWAWVQSQIITREEPPVGKRFRVDPVPATNSVRYRQWRVVDTLQNDKIIYPATDLGTAHRMADRLNRRGVATS